VGLRREAPDPSASPHHPWCGGRLGGHFEGGVNMKRCLMCFAQRATDPYPGTGVQLCRGCKYQVEKLIGFWETQGYGIQLAMISEAAVLAAIAKPTVIEEGEGGTPLTPQDLGNPGKKLGRVPKPDPNGNGAP